MYFVTLSFTASQSECAAYTQLWPRSPAASSSARCYYLFITSNKPSVASPAMTRLNHSDSKRFIHSYTSMISDFISFYLTLFYFIFHAQPFYPPQKSCLFSHFVTKQSHISSATISPSPVQSPSSGKRLTKRSPSRRPSLPWQHVAALALYTAHRLQSSAIIILLSWMRVTASVSSTWRRRVQDCSLSLLLFFFITCCFFHRFSLPPLPPPAYFILQPDVSSSPSSLPNPSRPPIPYLVKA